MTLPEQPLTPPEGTVRINYPSDDEILNTVLKCIKGETQKAYGLMRRQWIDLSEEAVTDLDDRAKRILHLLGDPLPVTAERYTKQDLIMTAKDEIDHAIACNFMDDLIEWGLV